MITVITDVCSFPINYWNKEEAFRKRQVELPQPLSKSSRAVIQSFGDSLIIVIVAY